MMNVLRKLYVMMYVRISGLSKGQSMTEYALILGAVAVAVFATYQLMGTDIKTMVTSVNSSLAPAA